MTIQTASLKLKKKPVFSHQEYLILAIPLIISGISTPMLGAVDTAVVGRIPDPASLGGVAIGAVIFNTMYWLLGFLRVSTSGFTAQAAGAKNQNEMMLSFIRPFLLSVIFGLLFILFQNSILQISLTIMGASEAVSGFASTYFSIRIWGAPFILLSYVIIGWLIGMGKVRLALVTQIGMNILNIILDLLFVLGLGMGVEGVAIATLIAEISGVMLGLWIIFIAHKSNFKKIKLITVLETGPVIRMMKVNRDFFLRTVCLLTMTIIFTSKGASMGELTLAANAILLQIQYIMAYLFGGFANASSIMVGRAIGGNNYQLYNRAYTLSAQWGFVSAFILSLSMYMFGEYAILLFTTITSVKEIAVTLLIWIVLFPIVGFWGLQLEGIFSGATDATSIRDSITLSLFIFLIGIWLLVPTFHNHGLWISFLLFSLSRSIFLSLFIPKLSRSKFV